MGLLGGKLARKIMWAIGKNFAGYCVKLPVRAIEGKTQ
jgi:hypothetical protein